jgi:hypothetical protein
MIKCTHAQEDSVAADLVLERALRLSLRFLGFLEASRIPLNSINRLVNTEKHTHTHSRRRIYGSSRKRFSSLSFSFYFIIMMMFGIKLMSN